MLKPFNFAPKIKSNLMTKTLLKIHKVYMDSIQAINLLLKKQNLLDGIPLKIFLNHPLEYTMTLNSMILFKGV